MRDIKWQPAPLEYWRWYINWLCGSKKLSNEEMKTQEGWEPGIINMRYGLEQTIRPCPYLLISVFSIISNLLYEIAENKGPNTN